MDYFKATYDEQSGTISIVSDTFWSIKSEGNFMLSKYSGNLNDTVKIIIPDTIQVGKGTIYFSYGNNSCIISPPLSIYQNNSNYFIISPSYIILKGKGTVAYVTVDSINGYMVSNTNPSLFRTLQYDNNKLMIVSNTDEEFGISSGVSLTLRNAATAESKNIRLYQEKNLTARGSSMLDAAYNKIDDNTYSVNVISLYKGNYNAFTFEIPNGVTATKQDSNTLIVKIVNNEAIGDYFSIVLKNDYTTYELVISRYAAPTSSVFNIAIECGGSFTVDGGSLKLGVLSQTVDSIFDREQLIENNEKLNNSCPY